MTFRAAYLPVLLVVASAACSPTTEPRPKPTISAAAVLANLRMSSAKSENQRLAEAMADQPNFAGFSIDKQGVTLYLTDTTERIATGAISALRARVANGSSRVAAMLAQPVHRQLVVHSFSALNASHERIGTMTAPAGVVLTAIDVRANHVVIGMSTAAGAADAAAWVSRAGVPLDMVETRVVPMARPASFSLTSRQRPVGGGIYIFGYPRSPGRNCTLGFNVHRPSDSNEYFLTASHCSDVMLGADGATPTAWQVDVTSNDSLAKEVSDPSPFSGGSCPSGKVCRWSDVSLFQYVSNSDAAFGKVAWGSPSSSTWSTTDGSPGAYSPICSTGISTGSTCGNYDVSYYCANFYPDSAVYDSAGVTIPHNLVFLCQDSMDFTIIPGDSGGPVFQWDYFSIYDKVFPWGIQHAGTSTYTWFSPFSSIENDFGTLSR